MKVLIYTHEFAPFLGGLGTTSLNLATGLSKAGLDITVLAPQYPEYEKQRDRAYPFEVKRMGVNTRNHGVPTPVKEINGYLHLKKQLKSFTPDAMIALTREAHAACGFNTGILPSISIARVAGYEAFRYLNSRKYRNRLLAIPMRRFYDKCRSVVAASSATRELFLHSGISPEKVKVIYNGVNTDMIESEVDEETVDGLRKKFGIRKFDIVLLTVSRVVRGKGQDTVIRALAQILPRHRNLKYLIVGEGPFSPVLSSLCEELGVSDNVIFTGPVRYDEIRHYYDLCDIFLMPNRTEKSKQNVEGLPNVIYEAASRGKPVIAGIPGGAKEIVKSGDTGFIVDGNVLQETVNSLSELAGDPQKRNIFGKRIKGIIRQYYTTDHMIRSYLNLLS